MCLLQALEELATELYVAQATLQRVTDDLLLEALSLFRDGLFRVAGEVRLQL